MTAGHRDTHGIMLAEGKTKKIWEIPGTDSVLIESKDDITAGDGARRDTIPDKGKFCTATTTNCFNLLERAGILTHFITRISERTFQAFHANMIPFELVGRRYAAGSFLKRHPEIPEGTELAPLVTEFFLKRDDLHDPLTVFDFVGDRMLLFNPKLPLWDGSPGEMPMYTGVYMYEALPKLLSLLRRTFVAIERAWQFRKVTLVDLKIECGVVSSGDIVVADVITNDEWRIWPKGEKSQMKDKQVYRDSGKLTPEVAAQIRENYRWVAEETAQF